MASVDIDSVIRRASRVLGEEFHFPVDAKPNRRVQVQDFVFVLHLLVSSLKKN